jgi:peptidoglycan-associated lipoprotein
MNKRTVTAALLASALILFAAGCKPKPTPAPPPPPPPPPAKTEPPPKPARPTATLTAEPSSVQRGQAVTLRWSVSGADSISIAPGVGNVPASGSREVYPNASTTYTLSASGPGGNTSASARVNVTEPPKEVKESPKPKPVRKSFSQRVTDEVQDVYFNYDKYDVREDARSVLTRNADALKAILTEYPGEVVSVEGHCDERGSAEYNLGLGDRRSSSTKDFLVQLGVPADRIKTVSYGKERPQCQDASEDCYQRNRRAHFAGQ